MRTTVREDMTGKERSRALNVVLALVFGASLVGFFVGTQPMPAPLLTDRPTAASADTSVMPGQSYKDLRLRHYGLQSEVTSDLNLLRASIPGLHDPVVIAEGERAQAVAARAERRAYEGAPPTVPHVMDEQSSDACLACHTLGIGVQGHSARVISHPPYTQCAQCHVSSRPREHAQEQPWTTSFTGITAPGEGPTAWPGAPPNIPHTLKMRDNCSSCHGVNGLNGLRTTHPSRTNCVQCHVPIGTPQPVPPPLAEDVPFTHALK